MELLDIINSYIIQWWLFPADTHVTSIHALSTSAINYLIDRFLNLANKRCWTNVGLMLDQRRRRWSSVNSALVRRLLLLGIYFPNHSLGGVRSYHDNLLRFPQCVIKKKITTESWLFIAYIIMSAGERLVSVNISQTNVLYIELWE